jgi:hypothetical protein
MLAERRNRKEAWVMGQKLAVVVTGGTVGLRDMTSLDHQWRRT